MAIRHPQPAPLLQPPPQKKVEVLQQSSSGHPQHIHTPLHPHHHPLPHSLPLRSMLSSNLDTHQSRKLPLTLTLTLHHHPFPYPSALKNRSASKTAGPHARGSPLSNLPRPPANINPPNATTPQPPLPPRLQPPPTPPKPCMQYTHRHMHLPPGPCSAGAAPRWLHIL
ncbi:unnamed protein product [Pleuronectes platessa]|uniref:Uncharacterized protein n=1 Tax=Pleuronectes platessa TaxID=8262 RepID=A0A9N7V6L6_PLEPL|nr:unnamed protein product [Pleuronectes platessa]